MFMSNYLQLVYVKVCGKFIISKFLPVVVLPSGFMLVLQSTIPETWHLCNERSGCAACLFLSSSFEHGNCTYVAHECVELANEEERASLLSSLFMLPQAMNEDGITLGHETAVLQLKCLPMNATGMHIKTFFSPVHFSNLRCYC